MFSFVFFGFNHVFLTGITAAKNNIQLQPYSSDFSALALHYYVPTLWLHISQTPYLRILNSMISIRKQHT